MCLYSQRFIVIWRIDACVWFTLNWLNLSDYDTRQGKAKPYRYRSSHMWRRFISHMKYPIEQLSISMLLNDRFNCYNSIWCIQTFVSTIDGPFNYRQMTHTQRSNSRNKLWTVYYKERSEAIKYLRSSRLKECIRLRVKINKAHSSHLTHRQVTQKLKMKYTTHTNYC